MDPLWLLRKIEPFHVNLAIESSSLSANTFAVTETFAVYEPEAKLPDHVDVPVLVSAFPAHVMLETFMPFTFMTRYVPEICPVLSSTRTESSSELRVRFCDEKNVSTSESPAGTDGAALPTVTVGSG